MPTDYHNDTQKLFIEFLKNEGMREVTTGEHDPISLVDSGTKAVVNYKPDVYCITKNRKMLIIQILDSQKKHEALIIADIARACIIKNIIVQGIIFVHDGTNEKTSNNVLRCLKTLIKGLARKGIDPLNLPNNPSSGAYIIEKALLLDKTKFFLKVKEYSIKRKWFN